MWDEFCQYLASLGNDFDLFISTPKTVNFSKEVIYQKYPNAYIYSCENRGRDMAPFLKILSCINLLNYQYICKLHTKGTAHREDGSIWRRDMCSKLLASKENIAKIKDKLNEAQCGIVAPEGHILSSDYYWGSNAARVRLLCDRTGLNSNNLQFPFVAGSMFWFKQFVHQ
jgi:lipopolysaccharide biosynthesis protein